MTEQEPADEMSRGDAADERDRVAGEREDALTSREGEVTALLADAELRDDRADARDIAADDRDVLAEHEAATYGVDYNIEDAQPFHVRKLAKQDRAESRVDRLASGADRATLAGSPETGSD